MQPFDLERISGRRGQTTLTFWGGRPYMVERLVTKNLQKLSCLSRRRLIRTLHFISLGRMDHSIVRGHPAWTPAFPAMGGLQHENRKSQMTRATRPIVVPLFQRGWLWRSALLIAALLSTGPLRAHVPQTFEVVYASGPLTVNGQQVQQGFIGEANGSVVRTGGETFATIVLEDDSITQLAPGTTVKFDQALHHFKKTEFETSFQLNIGEITSKVPKDDSLKRNTRLHTPSVAIGVRGTTFRVNDQQSASRLMVYAGAIQAQGSSGDKVEVPADFGTVVEAGAAVQPPSELPPPPDPVIGRSDDDGAVLHFRWNPTAPVDLWALEIAHDKAFARTVYNAESDQPQADVHGLRPHRRYYWRVASVDARRLHGRASEPSMVQNAYYGVAQEAHQEARQAARQLATGTRDVFDSWLERTRAYVRQGEYLRARVLYDALLEAQPNSVQLLLGRADASYLLFNYLDASIDFGTVLSVEPDNPDALLGQARVDVREGNFRRAGESLADLVKTSPSMPRLLETAAMAALGTGDRVKATALLRQALAFDPNNENARTLLTSIETGSNAMEELR